MNCTLTSEMTAGGLQKEDWGELAYFTHPNVVSHHSGTGCYLARVAWRLAWTRKLKVTAAVALYEQRLAGYLRNRIADIGPFRISAPKGRLCFVRKTDQRRRMTARGRIIIRPLAA